jgi:hypothetical protein
MVCRREDTFAQLKTKQLKRGWSSLDTILLKTVFDISVIKSQRVGSSKNSSLSAQSTLGSIIFVAESCTCSNLSFDVFDKNWKNTGDA